MNTISTAAVDPTATDIGALAEYRAAQNTIFCTVPGTLANDFAQQIIDNLAERTVVFTFDCMLKCGGTIEHAMTVKEAASLISTPRGICGRH